MKSIFVFTLFLFQASASFAAGLTIHAAEIGVGKFHRKDNQVHAYAPNNAWFNYILPVGVAKTPYAQKNQDGSFTIFFSHLDELLTSVEKISSDEKSLVSTFNIHGHGLPGHMWFPADAKTLTSYDCADWRESAAAKDDDNYHQYYSPISKGEILQIRQISNQSSYNASCTTGLREWQQLSAKHANLKKVFADNLQVHFLSCVVGLGKMGDQFTQGIAALLLKTDQGRVQTSMMYGLGDWSMSEGMGFWDYQNDAQLNKDNRAYPVDREDRAEMQKGSIRIAGFLNQKIASSVMANQDFLFLDDRMPGTLTQTPQFVDFETTSDSSLSSIRIPGTKVQARITR